MYDLTDEERKRGSWMEFIQEPMIRMNEDQVDSTPDFPDFADFVAWETAKNKTGEPAGSGSPLCSSEPNELECQLDETTTIDPPIRQVRTPKKVRVGKTLKQVRDDSPACYINKKLWNCRKLTITERCCIGLLNTLMENDPGYAWVRYEQLGHWLGLTAETVENMLRKLRQGGYLKDIGQFRGVHRWVVCAKWRNPPKKKRQAL
jgi:hypothetical protein